MIKKLDIQEIEKATNEFCTVVERLSASNKDMQFKINELVNAVNELQKRIDPPSAYEVMREKDAIIARHIGEKNKLREALETAKWYLMQIGHLNMSEHGLGSNRMMIDWCKAVALDGINKIKPVLEEKEDDDE